MSYDTSDRKYTPADFPRPCMAAPGGEPNTASYMAAAAMGVHEELCPFGAFVEEFPLHPEAYEIAREHGLWCRWGDPETGEPLEFGRSTFGRGTWVRCLGTDEGAGPDLNEMTVRGLLETGYNCPVFGHDCPAYYGFPG